ncbi:adenylate/guanylate cyclase domain-containing protein [Bradyrhizobium sp. STM 3557]|uniref:adenylate/guanylate cyclase domain-containing protein n=1 Tax=Bradyrhizobium sp. STM 3557 TaxID=578920 RepID=UPI00388D04A6
MVQERPVRVERRLAAILAADVAGYSRLMHRDEEATHAKVTALLTEAVHPAVAEHGGRIVKTTGDGFLAEFPSTVEAVRAAVQFQTRIKELTIGEAEDSRISFRVGVNIGDVIVEPHDIFGNGVNVAARLEGIGEPGGICISSAAYDQVQGKVGFEFADLGEQNLKNIARPVRAYAVAWDGRDQATKIDAIKPERPSPPRLSIVVLPFANLSGDPEQDYFVDGVTENLTMDLSRINGSFVIARNTAFTFKGKAMDVQKLGRELNVRYVLEGSVQRGGNRIRVSAQLICVETGNHLWAERFDKLITDLFDMQDEIVSSLANALNAQLIEAEARRAEHSLKPDAIDLVFQGTSCWNKGITAENMAQARGFFERALMLDPGNTEALVGIAALDTLSAAFFLVDDRDSRLAAAEVTLTKVLSMCPQHARAHLYLGAVQNLTKRAAQAVWECERALALDRNLADAHAFIGAAMFFIGRSEETEAHIQQAFRLSPRDPGAFRWMLHNAIAKQILCEDAEAVAWLRGCLEANRNYPIAHFMLAGALGLLGSLEEARAAVRAGLALDPTFTLRRMRVRGRMSDDPAFRAGSKRLMEGMRMAGVPEE